METVKVSGQAASAGLGSAAEIGKVLVSVLNAYPQSGMTASRAMDILTAAAREGNAEINEYAAALGKTLPLSTQLGVGFEQLAASLAVMTNVGMNVDVAATAFRGMETSLLQAAKGTSQQAAALRELGISYEGVMEEIKNQGFAAAMIDLYERSHGNIAVLEQLIPNVRALTGFLATAATQQDTYNRVIEATTNSEGDFSRAVEESNQRFSHQAEVFQRSIEAIGISIGERILPNLNKFLEGLSPGLTTAMDEAGKKSDETKDKFSDLGKVVHDVKDIIDTINTPEATNENVFDHLKTSAEDLSRLIHNDPTLAIILGIGVAGAGIVGARTIGSVATAGVAGVSGLFAGAETAAVAAGVATTLPANLPAVPGAAAAATGAIPSPLLQAELAVAIAMFVKNLGELAIVIGEQKDLMSGNGNPNEIRARWDKQSQDLQASWQSRIATGLLQSYRNSGTNLAGTAIEEMNRGAGVFAPAGAGSSVGGQFGYQVTPTEARGGPDTTMSQEAMESLKNWRIWRAAKDKAEQDAKSHAQIAATDFKSAMDDAWSKALDTDAISKNGQKMLQAVEDLFKMDAFDPALNQAIATIANFGAQVQLEWARSLDLSIVDKWQSKLKAASDAIAAAEQAGAQGNPDADSMMAAAKQQLQDTLAGAAHEQADITEEKRKQAAYDAQMRKDAEAARKARDIPEIGFQRSLVSARYDEALRYAGGGELKAAMEQMFNPDIDMNAAFGERVNQALSQVARAVKTANKPEFQAMYEELIGLVTVALHDKTPEAVAAVDDMLEKINSEIRASKQMTLESFSDAFSKTAISQSLGSISSGVIDLLSQGLEEDGGKLTNTLAEQVNRMGHNLQTSGIDPNIGKQLFSNFKDLIDQAIEEGTITPEMQDLLENSAADIDYAAAAARMSKPYIDAVAQAMRRADDQLSDLKKEHSKKLAEDDFKFKTEAAENAELAVLGEGKYGRDEAKRLRYEERDRQRDREDSETKISRMHEDFVESLNRAHNRQKELLQLQDQLNKSTAALAQIDYSKPIRGALQDIYGIMEGGANFKGLSNTSQAQSDKDKLMAEFNKRVQDEQREYAFEDDMKKKRREWEEESRTRQRGYQDEDAARELQRQELIEDIKQRYEDKIEAHRVEMENQSYQDSIDRINRARTEAIDTANQNFVTNFNTLVPYIGGEKFLEKIAPLFEEFIGAAEGDAGRSRIHDLIDAALANPTRNFIYNPITSGYTGIPTTPSYGTGGPSVPITGGYGSLNNLAGPRTTYIFNAPVYGDQRFMDMLNHNQTNIDIDETSMGR